MNKNNLVKMTLAAVFTALICITAPFTVPIGAVPISLATFTIYLSAATLGGKWGTAAVACYVALGLCGIPVLSGFTGGIDKLIGPTGGFIAGYIPCAAICGFISDFARRHHFMWNAVGMILGTAVCYFCGLLWYITLTGQTIAQGMAVCVIPFIAGDIIKIIAASALAQTLRSRVIEKIRRTR